MTTTKITALASRIDDRKCQFTSFKFCFDEMCHLSFFIVERVLVEILAYQSGHGQEDESRERKCSHKGVETFGFCC